MSNVVSVENVTLSYGSGVILDGVSLGLDDTDRVGVVGPNGAGKTSLLRILIRDEQPDTGRVTHRSGLRFGHLGQSVQFPATSTVRDVVVGSAWLPAGFDAEHEWAGDAGVRGILDGLGLTTIGLDTAVGPLSGGERRRVALAALLVRPTELLVLDEPTNHLDVEGVAWLAGHLTGRRGGLLVVTHDRWFLDAVCTRTWEVRDGQVAAYEGGYAAYVLARAERVRLAAAVEERRQNLLRKELAWLRRGPPARTSKPRFRIDAANALIADEPPVRDTVSLQRLATSRLGRRVYDVEDVGVRFGDRTILSDATWRIGPGDRIGLVGVNGSGKSTLLKLLVGELAPDSGTVGVGVTVRPAYLSQEVTELPPALRVLEAVSEVAERIRLGDRELTASQLAETFGFGAALQWTRVGDLSGGQRRRLQLLRLLMAEPNVLLLDEPTNDLDLDTLTALEDLLDSWPGTMIVVSHDRYLIERVCDQVYALPGDGSIVLQIGGVEQYLASRAVRPASAPEAVPSSEKPATDAARTRTDRKELARLERQVGKLEAREAELLADLAAHATDYTRVNELDTELRDVRSRREEAELAWLELAEAR